MRWVLAAAGAAAPAILVAVYVSPAWPAAARVALKLAALLLVGVFLADRLLRLGRSRHPKAYLLDLWPDAALLAAALLAAAVGLAFRGRFLPAAALYILLSRTWLLAPRRRLPVLLNVLLGLTGLVAVAALVLEYGFHSPPIDVAALHDVQTVVVALFILDRVVRLELARSRPRYLKENWVDFGLMLAAVAALAVARQMEGKILSAGMLYVMITQAYILVSLILRGVSVNLDFAGSGVHPHWLLIGSFAAMCLVGSGLLMLPAATQEVVSVPAPDAATGPVVRGLGEAMSYPDALFTATSATCVTGLIVRNTGTEFTAFGQAVVLGLIQLGGLGIMLFGTVLALLVGKGLSVRSSEALGQMIGTPAIGQIGRMVKFVVAVTIGLELLAAALLYPMFLADLGDAGQAVWQSIFHSVSSFCNAGFSLYDGNMEPLKGHWQVLGVVAPLIVLGGLGFPVIQDGARCAWRLMARAVRRRRPGARAGGAQPHLSLHSRIVLATSGILLVVGAAGFLLFGHRQPHKGVGGRQQALRRLTVGESVFQSVTARTAGFNTVDMQEDLSSAGQLWTCVLMIIGGSPASTAGGMKTATFALLVLAAWSMVKRRSEVEAFRRSISAELLRKTVTLAMLYLGLVGAVTLLLSIAMPAQDFMKVLFEACSACGTVGLSTGMRAAMRHNVFAKLVVVFGMFAGRIGPLTLLLALTTRMRHVRYAYPTEHVVIG